MENVFRAIIFWLVFAIFAVALTYSLGGFDRVDPDEVIARIMAILPD